MRALQVLATVADALTRELRHRNDSMSMAVHPMCMSDRCTSLWPPLDASSSGAYWSTTMFSRSSCTQKAIWLAMDMTPAAKVTVRL